MSLGQSLISLSATEIAKADLTGAPNATVVRKTKKSTATTLAALLTSQPPRRSNLHR